MFGYFKLKNDCMLKNIETRFIQKDFANSRIWKNSIIPVTTISCNQHLLGKIYLWVNLKNSPN
ncbi:MAG: hypothetical protein CL532_02060 [Aestuariivita sp.]|nr:hypothetical protein [Aestuariivita sp.]